MAPFGVISGSPVMFNKTINRHIQGVDKWKGRRKGEVNFSNLASPKDFGPNLFRGRG